MTPALSPSLSPSSPASSPALSPASSPTWEETNKARLVAALAELRGTLEKLLPRTEDREMREEAAVSDQAPQALETLCENFGLSGFERKILLMCAGVELDSRFAGLCAALNTSLVNNDRRSPLPTFSLALAAFEDAHWSALAPGRPLRHWRLVEVLAGDSLTGSPLRIDERILHYLTGILSVDERVRAVVDPLGVPASLPPSWRAVAEELAERLSRGNGQAVWQVVQLCGGDPAGRRAVAAAGCALIGLNLYVMSSQAVPRGMAEIDLFIRLWERESALHPCGLLLEFDDAQSKDAAGDAALKRMIETLRSPLLTSVRERMKPVDRRVLTFELRRATAIEQVDLWHNALGSAASALNGEVETLVSWFSLSAGSIDAAAAEAMQATDAPERLAPALWDACRKQSRPRLEGLAQRIEPAAAWDDLVLPEKQKQLLSQIAIQVRQRNQVYTKWGFGLRGARGLGISALFSGPSGTGKTMAGEVLANELRLDLYRIDLSQVISKYIGETEKNLRRVFDAADEGGAILLFDEADALFGKRSEVKDSHDRYANIEVSYLLQRMETYRGLAILTTNRRDALDTAFLRRIRFVVEFPFPEAPQRAEMWLRVFPVQTPTEGLRIDRLARLSAAGGNIRNIAMGAAFLAADAGEPVRMSHLLSAARSEFIKIERPLTDQETAGWV
jgi:hypothetical protein